MKTDIYGDLDDIRVKTTDLAVRVLAEKGLYPMMGRRHNDRQVNLLSIPKKSGETLMQEMIANGQGYPRMMESFRYMIKHYLCYVENPLIRKDKHGNLIRSYQKRIVTANPAIIAQWLEEDIETVKKRYSTKFKSYIDTDCTYEPVAPYLELKTAKDGAHKITKPRKDIDLLDEGLTVTPLYLINASLGYLTDRLEDECITFKYAKDNQQTREITTTFNHETLKEIYGDKTSWLMDAKAKMYKGEVMMECDTMWRGYVRVPEVGGSRYDSATRSLNFARISEIKYDVQPDTSMVDVDLMTVLPAFEKALADNPVNEEKIRQRFKGYDIDKANSLLIWEEKNEKESTTTFKRDLARFMLANTDIFKDFTGRPIHEDSQGAGLNVSVDGITNLDLADMDLMDYLEF